jgi:hypothetical protein
VAFHAGDFGARRHLSIVINTVLGSDNVIGLVLAARLGCNSSPDHQRGIIAVSSPSIFAGPSGHRRLNVWSLPLKWWWVSRIGREALSRWANLGNRASLCCPYRPRNTRCGDQGQDLVDVWLGQWRLS